MKIKHTNKNKLVNQLEELQLEQMNIGFIKSHPILNRLPIRDIDIRILELVLSLQSKNLDFFMNYDSIGEVLGIKTQSVRNRINNLKLEGYLVTNNSSNFNGNKGGSSTTLSVDLPLILKELSTPAAKATPTEKKPLKAIAVTKSDESCPKDIHNTKVKVDADDLFDMDDFDDTEDRRPKKVSVVQDQKNVSQKPVIRVRVDTFIQWIPRKLKENNLPDIHTKSLEIQMGKKKRQSEAELDVMIGNIIFQNNLIENNK